MANTKKSRGCLNNKPVSAAEIASIVSRKRKSAGVVININVHGNYIESPQAASPPSGEWMPPAGKTILALSAYRLYRLLIRQNAQQQRIMNQSQALVFVQKVFPTLWNYRGGKMGDCVKSWLKRDGKSLDALMRHEDSSLQINRRKLDAAEASRRR